MRRKTHEEFLKELEIINPNVIPLEKYKTAKTKIKCECKLCETKWDVVPDSLLHGYGCPGCYANKLAEIKYNNHNGKCEVCGREGEIFKYKGKKLCRKHHDQLMCKGEVLDNNSRFCNDKNDIRIDGDIAYISVYDSSSNKKGEVIIDSEDVEAISSYSIHIDAYSYPVFKIKNKDVRLNRFLLNVLEDKNYDVDHINHNVLDNRKSNLRLATKSQNMQNRKTKGYTIDRGKYRVEKKKDGVRINLQRWDTPEEAGYAAHYAEVIWYGEFSYYNYDTIPERSLLKDDKIKKIEEKVKGIFDKKGIKYND